MELGKLDIKNFFFLVVLGLLGMLLFRVFSPFLNVLVISLILVQIFHPVYRALSKKINGPLASFITTLISVATVVIPVILITIFASVEVSRIVGQISADSGISTNESSESPVANIISNLDNSIRFELESLLESLEERGITNGEELLNLTRDEETGELILNVGDTVTSALSSVQESLLPFATGLISGTVSLIFYGVLLIMALVYLFHDYEKLPKLVSNFSPLDDGLDQLLFKKLTDTTRAVILGNFVVAFAQATAVIIPIVLIGIPAPVLLWLIMVLFSLIPVGSGVVWVPVGIGLIVSGNPVAGVLLMLYGAIVINVIEATLRPYLLKSSIQLHPLVIMFSALGGIAAFGPLGLLYGPLIAVLFTTFMEAYTTMYAKKQDIEPEDVEKS